MKIFEVLFHVQILQLKKPSYQISSPSGSEQGVPYCREYGEFHGELGTRAGIFESCENQWDDLLTQEDICTPTRGSCRYRLRCSLSRACLLLFRARGDTLSLIFI